MQSMTHNPIQSSLMISILTYDRNYLPTFAKILKMVSYWTR